VWWDGEYKPLKRDAVQTAQARGNEKKIIYKSGKAVAHRGLLNGIDL